MGIGLSEKLEIRHLGVNVCVEKYHEAKKGRLSLRVDKE